MNISPEEMDGTGLPGQDRARSGEAIIYYETVVSSNPFTWLCKQ